MSDSQHQRTIRALSIRSLCVLVVLSLGALEVGVRRTYDPPTPMLDKARVFQAQQHTTDQLLIFGTCLPEQIISPQLLQAQIGENVEVQILATAAGTSRLMYLTLKNYIPEDAPVRGIVVPYGATDLTKRMDPYESQAMEIARLGDVSELVEIECEDPDCRTQMWLRKVSKAYRYRGYLANWFWQHIGSKPPIPGYVMSPGAVKEQPGDMAPKMLGRSRPDRMALTPLDSAKMAPDGGPPRQQDSTFMGPERMTKVKSDFRYLERFLALAKARNIPVFLLPLPKRSAYQGGESTHNDAYAERLRKVIEAHGGIHLAADSIPGLQATDFTDDVHLEKRGRALVTRALGKAVNAELAKQ
jgi:hypothetical protein